MRIRGGNPLERLTGIPQAVPDVNSSAISGGFLWIPETARTPSGYACEIPARMIGEILERVHEGVSARILGSIPKGIPRKIIKEIPKGMIGTISVEILEQSIEESQQKFLAESHQAFLEEF